MSTAAAHPDPIERLRAVLPSLTGAKRRVAELMIDEPARVGAASITVLAEDADTQPAVISRLAVRLGYVGYPALRAALASEGGRHEEAAWRGDAHADVLPTDPPARVLEVLTGRQVESMRSAMAAIDLDDMERLAGWVVAADRVSLFAEQDDLPPALDLRIRLRTAGIPTVFHSATGQSRSGDIALAMSRSGDSSAGAAFFEGARREGARTVAFTGEVDSPLARAADLAILTGAAAGSSTAAAFAGRMSHALAAALLGMLVSQRLPTTFLPDLGTDEL